MFRQLETGIENCIAFRQGFKTGLELVALLRPNLSSWCLKIVMVERLFLAVPRGCLRFVIVVFPDHINLLFLVKIMMYDFSTVGSPMCSGNITSS